MQIVEKGWGREIIFANNDKYCGKLLIYDKANSSGSMHFHIKKHETFYVQKGKFMMKWIEPFDASMHENILNEGDTWENEPGDVHQLISLEDNCIMVEVSTTDCPMDSYRVLPGDSQK